MPLGAASHMGRRDIAEILIEHGARSNLFTSTMLGHLEAVRAYIKARIKTAKVFQHYIQLTFETVIGCPVNSRL